MRFVVDECTGAAVANWLLSRQHEVFSVYQEARGLDDDEIIRKAFVENWILITNDRDFGEKVYRERRQHRGVVFLRLADERASVKIDIINKLIARFAEQLPNRFVVVTETQVRFARS
jgi:predicted nuclease of predicted toxin-antitoxin system